METISDRMQKFLEAKKLTAKAFEAICKLGNGTCASIGENTRSTTFNRISKGFPELNIDWLKTGQGVMFKQNPEIDIDLDLKLSGNSQLALRDINNIGDAKIQIVLLQEKVKSLQKEIKVNKESYEKDLREKKDSFEKEIAGKNNEIANLNARILDLQHFNNYLMEKK